MSNFFLNRYKRGETDGRDFVKPFVEANLELGRAIESLKRAAVERVRSIA